GLRLFFDPAHLPRLFCGLRDRRLGDSRNQKIIQLFTTLDGGSEPARLEPTASPGLGRVLRIAVFRCDGPSWATSAELDRCAAAKLRQPGKLQFELSPSLAELAADRCLHLGL